MDLNKSFENIQVVMRWCILKECTTFYVGQTVLYVCTFNRITTIHCKIYKWTNNVKYTLHKQRKIWCVDSDLPLTPSPPPLPHVSYEWDECSTSPSPQTPTRYVAFTQVFCNISHVFCTRHVSTALTGLTLILTCLTLLLLSLTLRVLHNLVFDNTPVWLFLHVHVFDSTQVLFLPIILVWVLSLLTCLKLLTCLPYNKLVWNYYYLVWHYYSRVWQNTRVRQHSRV